MMRILLGFIISASTVVANAQDTQAIKNFLTAPMPAYTDSESFFGSELEKKWSEAIDSGGPKDPELESLIREGREFRLKIVRSLRSFVPESELALVLAPDQEVLRRARIFLRQQNEMHEQPIPERRAQFLAWADTQTLFKLQHLNSPVELERLRFSDPKMEQAFQFYQTQYRRLLLQTQRDLDPNRSRVDEFKHRTLESLRQLRELQLRSFFQHLAEVSPTGLLTFVDSSGRESRMDVRQFLDAEVAVTSLLSPRHSPPEDFPVYRHKKTKGLFHSLRPSTFWRGYKQWSLNWRKTYISSEGFYSTALVDLELGTALINVKVGNRNFFLSESDLYSSMWEMIRLRRLGASELSRMDYRTLAHFQERDQLLALAMDRLASKHDGSMEDLVQRLHRVQNREPVAFKQNHTVIPERLEHSELNAQLPALQELKWYGYSHSPRYWYLRDLQAKVIARRSWSDDGGLRAPEAVAAENQLPAIEDKRAAQQKISRELPDSSRVRGTSAFTTGMLAGLVALYMGLSNFTEDSPSTARSGSGSGSQMGSTLPSNMSNESHDGMGIVPQGEMNGKKGQQLVFEITRQAKGTQIPQMFYHFNFFEKDSPLTYDQFYDLWDDGRVENIEVKVTKQIHEIQLQPGEFEIRTYLPTAANDSAFQSILAPAGYKLRAIQFSQGHDVVPDFFIVPSTGELFMQQYMSGEFTYRAIYTPITEYMPNDYKVSVAALSNEVTELNQAGAKDFAGDLRTLTSQAAAPTVSVGALANMQAEGSFYTFKGQPWLEKIRYILPNGSEYSEYRQFLRDGEFYYQCSGSNRLLRDILDRSFDQSGSKLDAMNINGYSVDGALVTSDKAHRQTMVTDPNQRFRYQIVDATPGEMAPGEKKNDGQENIVKPPEAKPGQTIPQDENQPRPIEAFIRPRTPRVEMSNAAADGDDSDDEAALETEEENSDLELVETPTVDLIDALKAARQESFATVHKERAKISNFPPPADFHRWPGLKLLPLSYLLLQHLEGELRQDDFLIQVYGLQLGRHLSTPTPEIREQTLLQARAEFSNDGKVSLVGIVSRFQSQLAEAARTRQDLGFLYNPEVAQALQALFEPLTGCDKLMRK